MNDALLYRLKPVARRFRSVRFWWCFAVAASIAAAVGWYFQTPVRRGLADGSTVAAVLLAAVTAAALLLAILCRLSFRDPRRVAAHIERRFPSLDQRLLTALSQKDNELGYLQQRVIKEARDHSREHRWVEAVPFRQVLWSRLSGLGATLFLAVILGLLTLAEPNQRSGAASQGATIPSVTVEPGNVEIERGSSLVVTARFQNRWFPKSGELVTVADDDSERRIAMTQSLDDPILGGFVASVATPFRYQIQSPYWQSDWYQVQVFDFPSLVRSDANLKYPDYTGLPEKRIEDTVRVSAVQGSEVTWTCFLNKPVATAQLVADDGSRIAMVPGDNAAEVTATITLTDTLRYELQLVDDAGRANKYPPELVATALPNGPPTLKLSPAGDVSVSPLEELPLGVEAHDDFGLRQIGLSFTFAAAEPTEIVLAENVAGGNSITAQHLVEFEALAAQPDQLLAYHFWAEDIGPDGQPRRTQSDMFFAEVRPFEEIMRQGEAPPGGQSPPQASQNGQQAEELAELQKQIINATWTIIRKQPLAGLDANIVDDTTLVAQSQSDALSQLEQLATQIRDPDSKQYLDQVRADMQTAAGELTGAVQSVSAEPLPVAMEAEKAAYAGLLKLRAREFQVTRAQQRPNQGQPSRSQQRRQEQLDELELDQDENRYETQRQAQESEQEQQQSEIRQVLNRLAELARRQEDLNKELAQLQSALQQAETQQQRDDIERQLKRLRDQQQDLLRETDELSERMQSPQNQQQMSDANEKLQQTRENVRQATEALQQNDAASALTSGTRAERQFEEMRDEFRSQAAGQFNDAVREMRSEAQELDQQQQQLAEQLSELQQPNQEAGLRAGDMRQSTEQQLEQQRQRLAELLDKMQQTVEQSETAEPLLAQKLYDSFRKTGQRQVDRKLQQTAELLNRGFDAEAVQSEQGAGEGIRQLRQELESAAETVLGDETKALQRAAEELEQLQRQLDDELQRNRPAADPSEQSGGRAGESEGSENRPAAEDAGQPGQPGGSGRSRDPNRENDERENSDRENPDQENADPAAGDQRPATDGQPTQSDPTGAGRPSPSSQPSEQSQPSESQGSSAQPSESQRSESQRSESQRSESQRSGAQPSESQRPGSDQPGGNQQSRGGQTDGGQLSELLQQFAAESPDGGGGGAAAAPLTGDGYREWSDRLREVEEMVGDPELRSQAARIRDRARQVRIDLRRHSEQPQWEMVNEMIAQPLRELRREVTAELLRRSAENDTPVPIDRDPVPPQFSEAVRQYYESLGSGR